MKRNCWICGAELTDPDSKLCPDCELQLVDNSRWQNELKQRIRKEIGIKD